MRRVVVGVLVVLLVVAGCSRSPKPDPAPTGPLPTRVASSASALCGVDPQSLELATGYAPGAASGELVRGSGYCSVPGAEGIPSDRLLFARIDPVDSEDGRHGLAELNGVGAREPDVRYGDVDGGAWTEPASGKWSPGGGMAVVVWGDFVVVVDTDASAGYRDTAADLLAFVRQVASSAGLGPYRASTSPVVTPSP
jgi:hypothetical protein